MKQLLRIASSISRVFNGISGVALVACVLIVTVNTITRKTPIGPMLGTYEIASYLAGIVIAFAIAWNQLKKVNIEADILVSRFSRRTRAVISSIIYLISTILFLVATCSLLVYGVELTQKGEVSATLNVPFYPWVFAFVLCFALMTLVLFTDFIQSIQEVRKP